MVAEAKYRLALLVLAACLVSFIGAAVFAFAQSAQIRALKVDNQALIQEKFQLGQQLGSYRTKIEELTVAQKDGDKRREAAQIEALARLEGAATRLGRIKLITGNDCAAAEAVLDAFSEGR